MVRRSLRFDCPSEALALGMLVRKARGAWAVCLALALLTHTGLGRMGFRTRAAAAARPLTTRFVKRQPRLTKPLELRKRPEPRRRAAERRMISVKAKRLGERGAGATESAQVLRSLARPRVAAGRLSDFSAQALEPQAMAGAIQGVRESRHAVDMGLELLDVNALDTGRYQAMVIEDPSDKRNIKGYLHLAIVYPLSVTDRERAKGEGRLIEGLQRLVAKLNEWTGINASVAKRIGLDSPGLFSTPWVYLRITFELEPNQAEVDNLGRYLLGGGFFFFEGARAGRKQGERHLTAFVTSALESQGYRRGADWELRPLSAAHPVFHCYYDFPDGVPAGFTLIAKPLFGEMRDDGVEPETRGIEMGGRLVVLSTNQGLGGAWCGWGLTHEIYAGDTYAAYDPTLQFRFGINTIIFALTQEGSITHRLMQRTR